ncbi:hypothetical protein BDV40DRAFT_306962 [Aspergillus tamarii]|uniref:Uncharacterized protein n=1 Tax=Aspergillus tamarii TaxID=41984 RepID=A0A5N6UB82_ASPTM|nr:hypothetical protein BDV40DRAFT_306962 [Aspergillus tamarii]
MGTQFTPALQSLRLSCEKLQSFAAFLQGEESIAGRLDVPLACDTKAENINSIFSDNNREVDCGIHGLDAVHQLGIPSLLGSFTYPTDVQAEGKTMRIVEESLATLRNVNKIACQIIQKSHECQERLNERFATGQLNSHRTPPLVKVNLDGQRGTTETSCVTTQKRTKQCRPRPWKHADLVRLPQWFQQYKYLRSDNVQFEAQFEKDFGDTRTGAAIKSAYYRALKRRTQRRPGDGSRSSATNDPSLQLPIPTLEPPISFPKAQRDFSMLDPLSGGATRMLVGGSPHAPHTGASLYTTRECNRRHPPLNWQNFQVPEPSSAWNYPQGTAFRYAIQNDPPTGPVEQSTTINQFEHLGKPLNGNPPSLPSNLSPLNWSWFNAPVVLRQDTLGDGKISTTNKLPPLVNASTNYQVVPSISFTS